MWWWCDEKRFVDITSESSFVINLTVNYTINDELRTWITWYLIEYTNSSRNNTILYTIFNWYGDRIECDNGQMSWIGVKYVVVRLLWIYAKRAILCQSFDHFSYVIYFLLHARESIRMKMNDMKTGLMHRFNFMFHV